MQDEPVQLLLICTTKHGNVGKCNSSFTPYRQEVSVMKKFYSLVIAMTLAFSVSCFLQDDEDEAAPVGSGTVTVKATYTGTIKGDVVGVSDGTGKVFVYFFNTLTTADAGIVYSASTAAAVSLNVEETISKSGIAPGTYYVLVFYDYKAGAKDVNQTDRYELYNNHNCAADASTITVGENSSQEVNHAPPKGGGFSSG